MKFEELLRNKFENYESNEKPDWKTFRRKIKSRPNYNFLARMVSLSLVLSLIGYNGGISKIKIKTLPAISHNINIHKKIVEKKKIDNVYICKNVPIMISIKEPEKNPENKMIVINSITKNELKNSDSTTNIITSMIIDTIEKTKPIDTNVLKSVSLSPKQKQLTWYFLPTGFTPDFNGRNDVFKPEGTNLNPDGYIMCIYNRYGRKLFETRDLNYGWNGGKERPDSYIWIIHMKDEAGILRENIGYVVLIK
jgi:gliding motility-associated-like protein